jgi:hypothetical protein
MGQLHEFRIASIPIFALLLVPRPTIHDKKAHANATAQFSGIIQILLPAQDQ